MGRHQHLTRQLARAIQLGEWNRFFICRNLENRIGRGVNDPAACATLFFGKPIDYIGPAANHVTDDGSSGRSRESVEQITGKSVWVRRERLRQMHPSYLPVTGGAVFSRRRRTHASPRAGGVTTRLHPFKRLDLAETKSLQSRQLEPAARPREVAQRIAAGVAVRGRIRSLADTYAVEDDYRCALQLLCPVYTRSTRDRRPVSSSYGEIPASSATRSTVRSVSPDRPINVTVSPTAHLIVVMSIIVMSIVTRPATVASAPPTSTDPTSLSARGSPSAYPTASVSMRAGWSTR